MRKSIISMLKQYVHFLLQPRLHWWLHISRPRLMKSLAAVGQGVEFDETVCFAYPSRMTLGNHIYIGSRTQFFGSGPIRIDDHVIIAPEVVIMSSIHHWQNAAMLPYDQQELLKQVTIERCVWVGLRALIMPGVTIGEGSIIASGAVVSKSCPPGSVVAGNPAQIIKTRDIDLYRQLVAEGKFYLKTKQEEKFMKEEVSVESPLFKG